MNGREAEEDKGYGKERVAAEEKKVGGRSLHAKYLHIPKGVDAWKPHKRFSAGNQRGMDRTEDVSCRGSLS
jgi:hypothetical protein